MTTVNLVDSGVKSLIPKRSHESESVSWVTQDTVYIHSLKLMSRKRLKVMPRNVSQNLLDQELNFWDFPNTSQAWAPLSPEITGRTKVLWQEITCLGLSSDA